MSFDRLIQIALILAAVVTLVTLWRGRQRRQTIRETAPFLGFSSLGETNPFLGVPVTRVPGAPGMLIDLVDGRAVMRNVLQGETPAGAAIVFDGRFPNSNNDGAGPFSTVAAYRIPGVPDFQLTPRIRFIFGVKTVAFPSSPDFSRRFTLFAGDEVATRRIFTPEVIAAFAALAEKKPWHVQAGSGWLLATRGLAKPEELGELVRQSAELAAAISRSARTVARA